MHGTETDVRIGREVKHEVAVAHGHRQAIEIERVSLDERKRRVSGGVLKEPAPACRKVVVPDDPMSVAKKPLGEVTANETCGARHEHCHSQVVSGSLLIAAARARGFVTASSDGVKRAEIDVSAKLD